MLQGSGLSPDELEEKVNKAIEKVAELTELPIEEVREIDEKLRMP